MEALRRLPPLDLVLGDPSLQPMIAAIGRSATADLVRLAIDRRREDLQAGAVPAEDRDAEAALIAELTIRLDRPPLRPVINATGVVIHTNLGRSPLPAEAVDALSATAGGYADVELDLTENRRGSRQSHVAPLIADLVGADRGLAVNNAAGALVLVLAALARGREVVVSRGQLIEIGDGFRLPEIMEQAGARLVEVGSTNRTRPEDYERAIGPDTALLLRAHPSNFRVVGFVEEVDVSRLAEIGRAHGVPVVDDIGSGLLAPDPDLPGEPDASGSIAAGADVVLFSGDKLLGGPQAGLIAGRDDLLERIARHPLARALRIDRLSLATLEATLRLHRDPVRMRQAVPSRRMIAMPVAEVRDRAERLAARVGGTVVDTAGRVGGGALPAIDLPSAACALPDPDGALHRALRMGEPAILGRLEDGALLLDCRTLLDERELDAVAERVRAVADGG
jgi:L-seryl-tRNA(Ser) seleniumtransferase